jgi:PPK2 family polyphosphate:nucleotide phosphotransferase
MKLEAEMKDERDLLKKLAVPPGKKARLKKYDPTWTGSLKDEARGRKLLERGVRRLSKQQALLYAQDTYSVLVIFQAMDAAGKDGAIRHVLSGVNPQGCQVFSFKAPSAEERDHTYLWRSMKALPERGRIGIHNRSYYEEVLVARVHKEILASQQLPEQLKGGGIWKRRFREICNFERYLTDNGMVVIKFFLHVSKEEQRRRFLSRIDEEDKNWKFSIADAKERAFWDDYMKVYEDMLEHTSTDYAPWYVVPADNKWFTRLAVSTLLHTRIAELKLQFPKVTEGKRKELQEIRRMLIAEDKAAH